MKKSFGIAALAGLLAAGCAPERPEPRTLADFRPGDALVTVNGESYLKSDFDRDVETRFALVCHRKGTPDEKTAATARQRIGQGVLMSMVEGMLSRQRARKLNITGDPVVRRRVEARYAQTFGRRRGKVQETFDDIARSLGEHEGDFRRIVGEEVISEFCVRAVSFGATDVSDAAVAAKLASMRRENDEAAATNAVLFATASNVWVRAFNGVSFSNLVEECSQELGRKPGGVICGADGRVSDLDANDFAVEKLEDGSNPVWEAISKLRDGDVTPPLPSQEGIAIYKCLEYLPKSESTGRPAWRLARLVFRRALLYPEYTAQELKDELERLARRRANERYSQNLREGARIEFPNGISYLPAQLQRAYWRLVHPAPPATNATERSASPTNAAPPAAETNRLAKSPRSGR